MKPQAGPRTHPELQHPCSPLHPEPSASGALGHALICRGRDTGSPSRSHLQSMQRVHRSVGVPSEGLGGWGVCKGLVVMPTPLRSVAWETRGREMPALHPDPSLHRRC